MRLSVTTLRIAVGGAWLARVRDQPSFIGRARALSRERPENSISAGARGAAEPPSNRLLLGKLMRGRGVRSARVERTSRPPTAPARRDVLRRGRGDRGCSLRTAGQFARHTSGRPRRLGRDRHRVGFLPRVVGSAIELAKLRPDGGSGQSRRRDGDWSSRGALSDQRSPRAPRRSVRRGLGVRSRPVRRSAPLDD